MICLIFSYFLQAACHWCDVSRAAGRQTVNYPQAAWEIIEEKIKPATDKSHIERSILIWD